MASNKRKNKCRVRVDDIPPTDYLKLAMHRINSDPASLKKYNKLCSNKEWQERFNEFFQQKKTLPLLYDPFFKAIFNPNTHDDRLSKLLTAILGMKVTVIEVLPCEDSEMNGMLVIMDIIVKLEDGSLADIEVQKASYLFPAERLSCYSSDLMMRQYRRIRDSYREKNADDGSGKKRAFSYKEIRKVHTIIFYEKSDSSLRNDNDRQLYFHVGKTVFNTGIDLELMQDYCLISLDTFRKYRYPKIIEGDTKVTMYDYDESAYKFPVSEDILRMRLMFLSLFVTDTVENMNRLLVMYPEISEIIEDMNYYLTRPEEVLGMYSEMLAELDRNSMQLLIDEEKERADAAEARADEAEARANALEAELIQLRIKFNITEN